MRYLICKEFNYKFKNYQIVLIRLFMDHNKAKIVFIIYRYIK